MSFSLPALDRVYSCCWPATLNLNVTCPFQFTCIDRLYSCCWSATLHNMNLTCPSAKALAQICCSDEGLSPACFGSRLLVSNTIDKCCAKKVLRPWPKSTCCAKRSWRSRSATGWLIAVESFCNLELSIYKSLSWVHEFCLLKTFQ